MICWYSASAKLDPLPLIVPLSFETSSPAAVVGVSLALASFLLELPHADATTAKASRTTSKRLATRTDRSPPRAGWSVRLEQWVVAGRHRSGERRVNDGRSLRAAALAGPERP